MALTEDQLINIVHKAFERHLKEYVNVLVQKAVSEIPYRVREYVEQEISGAIHRLVQEHIQSHLDVYISVKGQ